MSTPPPPRSYLPPSFLPSLSPHPSSPPFTPSVPPSTSLPAFVPPRLRPSLRPLIPPSSPLPPSSFPDRHTHAAAPWPRHHRSLWSTAGFYLTPDADVQVSTPIQLYLRFFGTYYVGEMGGHFSSSKTGKRSFLPANRSTSKQTANQLNQTKPNQTKPN